MRYFGVFTIQESHLGGDGDYFGFDLISSDVLGEKYTSKSYFLLDPAGAMVVEPDADMLCLSLFERIQAIKYLNHCPKRIQHLESLSCRYSVRIGRH